MFYENPKYQIINEYTDPQNTFIAHVFVFCDEFMLLCPSCAMKVKKDGFKRRYIWDYNENKNRFEKIELKSQRYICKNPDCRRLFRSGDTLDKASHTREFDRHLALFLITNEIRSLTKYGKMFSLSHTTISDIVCGYAKSLNLHFAPPFTSCTLYLHPFLYQNIRCFYLGAVDIYGNHILLDFFGYEDAKKEALDYFRLHWKHDEYPYTPVEIVTNFDLTLFDELETMFVYPILSVAPHFLNQWLENFKTDNGNAKFSGICSLINFLKSRLRSPETDDEYICRWWNKQDNELKHELTEMWNSLSRRLKECNNAQLYNNIDFSGIDYLIKYYNSVQLPFPIMAARMLCLVHGETILQENKHDIYFDSKTGIQYRTIPPYGSVYRGLKNISPNIDLTNHLFDFADNSGIKLDKKVQKLLTELPF